MPTIEYTIRKLEEQKGKVHSSDFEVWLNTTHSYIEDQFKSYSTRARNFGSIISDYRIQKIGDAYGQNIDKGHFKSRAIDSIDDCISYLKDERSSGKKPAQAESLRKETKDNSKEMSKRLKSSDEYSNSSGKVAHAPPADNPKTQLPFGIRPALWWSIFTIVVGAAFYLGKEFGQNRFDKEKSDWYEENKELKKHIQTVKDNADRQEEHFTKIIGENEQEILRLEKELNEINKDYTQQQ